MWNATSMTATRLTFVLVTVLSTSALAVDPSAPSAEDTAKSLRSLLTGAVVTDGECVAAMRLVHAAWRLGRLGPAVELLMDDRDTTSRMLAELSEAERRRFLEHVLSSDPPLRRWLRGQLMRLLSPEDAAWTQARIDSLDASTATLVAELKGLSFRSPAAWLVAEAILRGSGGYAALRDGGVLLGLYLSGNHRTEVAAGLVQDLESGSATEAAAAARVARMIGVARIAGFGDLVASLSEIGRRRIGADLDVMSPSATRDGLAAIIHPAPRFASER